MAAQRMLAEMRLNKYGAENRSPRQLPVDPYHPRSDSRAC